MFLSLSLEPLHWSSASAQRCDLPLFCPVDSICNDSIGQKTDKSHLCAVVKLVQRKSACSIDKFDFFSCTELVGI